MFKLLFIPAVTVLMFGCDSMSAHKNLADSIHAIDTALKAIPPAKMIVPGKSIGEIHINENADSLIKILGKPDSRNAAMGTSYMMWYDKHGKNMHHISIYAQRNKAGAINNIKEIFVTSNRFKTADYAGAGSALKDVIKLYKLKKHIAPGDKKLWLYDNYQEGIGFEVDSTGKCLAVYVHAPGDSSVTDLNIH